MADETHDAFFAALAERMPVHECGRRFQPGGLGETPMLVCPPCSYLEAIDPVTFTTLINGAVLAAEEASRG